MNNDEHQERVNRLIADFPEEINKTIKDNLKIEVEESTDESGLVIRKPKLVGGLSSLIKKIDQRALEIAKQYLEKEDAI